MIDKEIIDTAKITFLGGLSLYFVKIASCLIARGFKRFLTLELEKFKHEFKDEIIEEIKKLRK